MSRLIDADALAYIVASNGDSDFINKVTRLMIDAPSIDFVRCKECRWNDGKGHCKLRYGSLGVFEDVSCDDFCSYGEREDKCKECWHWSEAHKRCENKCGCQFKPYGERKESE